MSHIVYVTHYLCNTLSISHIICVTHYLCHTLSVSHNITHVTHFNCAITQFSIGKYTRRDVWSRYYAMVEQLAPTFSIQSDAAPLSPTWSTLYSLDRVVALISLFTTVSSKIFSLHCHSLNRQLNSGVSPECDVTIVCNTVEKICNTMEKINLLAACDIATSIGATEICLHFLGNVYKKSPKSAKYFFTSSWYRMILPLELVMPAGATNWCWW